MFDRVQAFLEDRGLATDQIVDSLEVSLGEPLLAVATGSVAAGFANGTSDLDIYIVCDAETTTMLPLMSHMDVARIETKVYPAERVKARLDHLLQGSWPAFRSTRSDHLDRRKLIDHLSRFSLGVPLAGTSEWLNWWSGLEGAFQGVIYNWWCIEAQRRMLVAQWLSDVNPRLAALRANDAILAALEAIASAKGESYFRDKWLLEKLHRSAPEHLPVAYEALNLTASVPCMSKKVRLVEALLEQSGERPRGQSVNVTLAPGTRVTRVGDTSLVSRWNLRTLELTPSPGFLRDLDDVRVDEETPCPPSIWNASIDEPLPEPVLEMVVNDMCWVAITS